MRAELMTGDGFTRVEVPEPPPQYLEVGRPSAGVLLVATQAQDLPLGLPRETYRLHAYIATAGRRRGCAWYWPTR